MSNVTETGDSDADSGIHDPQGPTDEPPVEEYVVNTGGVADIPVRQKDVDAVEVGRIEIKKGMVGSLRDLLFNMFRGSKNKAPKIAEKEGLTWIQHDSHGDEARRPRRREPSIGERWANRNPNADI